MSEEQFILVDDGTLDTVIQATCCGKEYRFSYDADMDGPYEDETPEEAFENWRGNLFDNLREEHECEKLFQVTFGTVVEVRAANKHEAATLAWDKIQDNSFEPSDYLDGPDPIITVELCPECENPIEGCECE